MQKGVLENITQITVIGLHIAMHLDHIVALDRRARLIVCPFFLIEFSVKERHPLAFPNGNDQTLGEADRTPQFEHCPFLVLINLGNIL